MMSRPSSTEDAIGFSTSTCTPRSMQVSAMLAMQMRGRRDRDRVDAAIEQLVDIAHGRAAERAADELGLRRIRIGDDRELDAGNFSQHARMV